MIKLRYIKEKNRLYIKMIGRPTDKQLSRLLNDLESCIFCLKPNFDLINDMTEFVPVSHSATKEIKKIHRFLEQQGIKRVVRIGPNEIAKTQLMRTQFQSNSNYSVYYVSSLEEAEKILDSGPIDNEKLSA